MKVQPLFRRVLFAVFLLVTLAFGWWPLRFSVPNDVDWRAREGGLICNPSYEAGDGAARGLAVSAASLDTSSWDEVSVLVELDGRAHTRGLGVFLELYEGGGKENPPLLLAQWQDHLAVRSRSESKRGYDEIGYRDCFGKGKTVQIVLSCTSKGTTLYVDGVQQEVRKGYSLIGIDGRFSGRILFGNSADGTRPFTGDIARVAFYNRSLRPVKGSFGYATPVVEYDFLVDPEGTGDLGQKGVVKPERFVPLERSFLEGVNERMVTRVGFRQDVVVNLFGFVPIGLCFAGMARRHVGPIWAVLITVAMGSFVLSFAIEWGQGYLVHRHSSLLDLLLNTCGGVLACGVPRRWIPFL